jgi:signal transduction histidine kinase
VVPRALSGFGARLVAALLLVSVVSLAIAAVALLSPLEHRLRDERLDALTAAALRRAPGFDRLTAGNLGTEGVRLARSLGRSAGAQVQLVDARGNALVSTDPDEPVMRGVAVRAVKDHRLVRALGRRNGTPEAGVAVPVRIGNRTVALVVRGQLNDAQTAVDVVRRAFLEAAAIAFAAALVLGLALALSLARRLRSLRDTALRVAEGGSGVEVPSDSSRDEVGDLTRAVATMQTRLAEQERARRRFVSTASHELRTPLASLQLRLGLLREDLSGSEPDLGAAREELARAETQTEELARLAADLLDLSRIDAGAPLRREPLELGELCRAVLGEFGARLDEEGRIAELTARTASWTLADPTAVARIVRILIDNALKFSPPATAVTVEVGRDGEAATVSVRDRGPGVPPAERDLIFERFERGGERNNGGFGLGLAIGRELALRMGGDLRLDDADSGASFTLSLACAPAPGPPR